MVRTIRVQKQRRSWKCKPLRKVPAICALALIAAVALQSHLRATPDEEEAQDETATEAKEEAAQTKEKVIIYGYKLIRTYPHDTTAFTQGLVYENGFLYEGTGLYGESVLTKRELKTDTVRKRIRLGHQYFGEGITVFGEKVYQLTWKSGIGFTYDKETFRPLDEFSYRTQGWGLTHNNTHLILSDGTATLHFLDPNTFAEARQLTVCYAGGPVRQLNELEFIDGRIYANVLPTNYIAIISPKDGQVTAWIDLRGLYPPPLFGPSNNILNGIAYIPESKHLLVTGKRWPKMYEIELVRQTAEESK